MKEMIDSKEYRKWIIELKEKFQKAQIKASVKVNTTMLEFYWELGKEIVEKQKNASWGTGFLKQLSNDLKKEFSDIKGFSKSNLEYIRRWYLYYYNSVYKSGTTCATFNTILKLSNNEKNHEEILEKILALLTQIPWGHNRFIISNCKDIKEALFYINETIKNSWSRVILVHQLESRLYERQGKAINNFSTSLPKIQSDLAREMLKDPYNFDFLTLTENYNERELEKSLLKNIRKFLLELGAGFAFVAEQYKLEVGEREFFIDLLFYHTIMHCYVVIELKTVDFEPEFAGKLNFYIKAVDMQIKTNRDEPSIGILLCKSKDKVVVEYSLSDIHKPMGISEYDLVNSLPDKLKSALPSIEEIEAELMGIDNEK